MARPLLRGAEAMHSSSLSKSITRTSTALALLAATTASAQPPAPAPAFAPYIEVRTITTRLPGTPGPGAYVTRRLAVDRTGMLGGRVIVATQTAGHSPGRIDLVEPQKGTITLVGGPDLGLPSAVTTPWYGSAYPSGIYYFQQQSLPKDPGASRRVSRLNLNTVGLGVLFSGEGMDVGTGLAFAPKGFGEKLGGQLFGSDASNAAGAAADDGIRRWDAAGNFTNEIVGPLNPNPDTYTDLTFTGPEFGAHANRLVAINTTGVQGENILMWAEAALLGDDPRQAYDARQVFAAAKDPISRATYGAYGLSGYLFGMTQSTIFRYDANGKRAAFLTAAPGFNDLEFGAKRSLYVADLYGGLYEVRPSPAVFAAWLLTTGCGPAKPMAELVASWRTGEICPGAGLVCGATEATCGGGCFSDAHQATISAAVAAICQNPC